jgi:hypothetical protein
MLRASFLLTVLPALAVAAPAPFPRERRDADAHGWSKPVDGLRVRLLAHKKSYRVGETVRLTLEIQNVGDSRLVLEEPHLSRSIDAPGQSFGWAITCESARDSGRADERALDRIRKIQPMRDLVRMSAGEILRIEILAKHGDRQLEKLKLLADDEPRQEELYFSEADAPGVYELRATFRRSPRVWRETNKRAWSAPALTSPPVRIALQR